MFCCSLMIFFQNHLKKSFRNASTVPNSLDPDQARYFVRPKLIRPTLFAKFISRRQLYAKKVQVNKKRTALYGFTAIENGNTCTIEKRRKNR